MVLMAIMLLVLVAIIGLAVDVGYVYVSYARLRRAVDAAALDAANQIKKNYSGADLERAAVQFLQLNDVNDPSAEVRFCNPKAGFEAWHEPAMCPVGNELPRKLVAVKASSEVPTFFMSVLGFDTVTISASAESEAASVEVILVIDVSASQAQLPPSGNNGDARADPYWCNNVNLGTAMEGGCLPFENVKTAALSFAKEGVDLEYDRIAIITFSRFATRTLELTGRDNSKTAEDALDEIELAIRGLQVEELDVCPSDLDAEDPICRSYSDPAIGVPDPADEASWSANFNGLLCPGQLFGTNESACKTTNSGAGLLLANEMLVETARKESTWVVIFLTDGRANIGFRSDGTVICPLAYATTCTDGLVSPYRDPLDPLYAPDDYARVAMNALFDNQVILFTIGQGNGVNQVETRDLLEYAQNHSSGNGASFFGSADDLNEIFETISTQISTRITR